MLFRLNGAQLRPFNNKTTTLYTDSETALIECKMPNVGTTSGIFFLRVAE